MRIVLAVLMVFSFSAHADYFQDNAGQLYYLDHSDVLNGWASHLPSDAVSITDAQAATVQAAQQAALPPVINSQGFNLAVQSILGGTLSITYSLLFQDVAIAAWPHAQSIIIGAQTSGVITSTQYAAIKAAAATFNIPITL